MFLILSCSSSKVYKESGITNLTQLTTDKSIEVDPCITQDGTKIIFASDRGGGVELWMMPISASGGIQQITVSSKSEDRAPDYSDSTNEIVFQSTRVTGNWNIWKISLGNRGLTQLTNNEHGSFYPKWSPDSKKITFTAIDKNGDPYIWVMGSNGENSTQLGPGAFPDWSPNGTKILYSSWTDTDNADVWVMNFDGTEQIQITREREKQELYPVWSKDGKRIAYVVLI
jgi:Tol biopolymer transport system component